MARKTQERQKCCWIEQLGTPLGRDELGRSRGENYIEPLSTISGVWEHGLVLPVSGCAHKAQVWGAKAAAGITLSQTTPHCSLLLAAGTARLQTRATNPALSSDYRDKRWALSLPCNTNVTLMLLPSAKRVFYTSSPVSAGEHSWTLCLAGFRCPFTSVTQVLHQALLCGPLTLYPVINHSAQGAQVEKGNRSC